MIDYNKKFETNKVLIRPIQLEDFDEMFELTADPEMWIYFTSDLSNKEELTNWIKAGINDQSLLALTVIDAKTNKIIGSTSIGNISVRDKRVEIGRTWLGKNYQGKGFNAAVKHQLIQYLFDECNFERIELKTDVLNIAARKAMTKIGLIEEGVLRSHKQMIRNRRRDSIFYSVLKNEWNEMKIKNEWL